MNTLQVDPHELACATVQALEALLNVPEVGRWFDRQHAATQAAALARLASVSPHSAAVANAIGALSLAPARGQHYTQVHSDAQMAAYLDLKDANQASLMGG